MTNKRKMSHSPEKENLGIIKRPRKSVGNARKNLQVSFCKDVITESESGEKNNNSESDQLTDSTVPVNNSITSNRASQAGKRRRESMICESNGFSYDQSYKSSPKKTLLFNVMMKNDKTIQDLKKDIEEKNKKIEMLENESEKCQGVCQVESPLLRQLVDAHLRNKDVKQPQGRRWTFQDKMLSLNVLKRGVAAYKFLHAQDPTSFPSERTAQRFFNQLTMNIGLDDDYLEALAKKLSTMDPKARLFTLGADEYSIQPIPVFDMYTDRIVGYQNYGKDMPHLNSPDIANKCLVFMLQGLYTNIAQPLAFYFNRGGIKGSDLTELTLKIIRKLKSKGIIVKAFVTDQAKPNCLAMDTLRGYGPKTKCVCPAATAIPKRMCMCRQKTHFISDGVTIYVIPDAPHEWKCVKNNWNGDWDTWMKENKKNYKNDDKLKSAYPGCTLSIDGIVGAWKDLVLLYDIKKSEGDTIWNDQMMFPGSRDKMRVKLTTRLASLKTYAELKSSQFIKAKKTRDEKDGQKNQDSNNQDTALVIWLLNAICDITNGPSKSDKKSCPERCLVTKNSYHWEGWKKFMKMLENTHFIKMDKTTTVPPSISNLRLTMSAMSDLCDELLNQHGFESVNLRRMHQDVIENFFSLLRSALDANSTPSAIETMRLVKCLIISKFSSPSTRDSNCEKDDSEFLLNQKDWFELSKKSKEKVSKLQANCTNNNVSIVVNDDNNDPVFHIPDYDSDCGDIVELIFVSNDFLPRLVTREMMKHLNVNNCEECKSCFIKNTGDEYCWEPTDKFVKLITDCHKIFEDKIAPEPNMENIANTTITEFDRGITRIDWLCTRHEENIKILLLPKLARIFISRLISMSVRKFKTFASRVNNVAKINQQTLFDNEAPDDKYIPQIKKRKLKHQAPADC